MRAIFNIGAHLLGGRGAERRGARHVRLQEGREEGRLHHPHHRLVVDTDADELPCPAALHRRGDRHVAVAADLTPVVPPDALAANSRSRLSCRSWPSVPPVSSQASKRQRVDCADVIDLCSSDSEDDKSGCDRIRGHEVVDLTEMTSWCSLQAGAQLMRTACP